MQLTQDRREDREQLANLRAGGEARGAPGPRPTDRAGSRDHDGSPLAQLGGAPRDGIEGIGAFNEDRDPIFQDPDY